MGVTLAETYRGAFPVPPPPLLEPMDRRRDAAEQSRLMRSALCHAKSGAVVRGLVAPWMRAPGHRIRARRRNTGSFNGCTYGSSTTTYRINISLTLPIEKRSSHGAHFGRKASFSYFDSGNCLPRRNARGTRPTASSACWTHTSRRKGSVEYLIEDPAWYADLAWAL